MRRLGGVGVTGLAAALNLAAALGEVVLVADGQPRAVVVTASAPSPVAKYAAEELVWHVEKATGVKLPVATEDAVPAAPAGRVFIGPCAAAAAAGIDTSKLALEACVLRTAGATLFVAGEDTDGAPLATDTRAGTLWGVYELLETVVNVRWLWPGELGVEAPQAARIAIPDLDRTVAPKLLQRQVRPGYGKAPARGGFSAAGREQNKHEQQVFLRRHRMGRSVRFRYGHAFENWWDKYGAEHPDWFQLLENGRRGPTSHGARFSMCVSNPGFHAEIVNVWRKLKSERPGEFVNLNCCENDIHGLCTCDACRAWDGPQPEKIHPRFGPHVVSDRYARYWLAVQQLAAREDPEAKVLAYAYVNYAPPPSPAVRLNEHIIVGTVPDLFFPRTPEGQQWVLDQWDGWARTGCRLFLRPNYTLGGYCMPHIYSRQFAAEFRYEAQRGMAFTDFDSLTGQWATQGPTLYLLMRLHLRPERTADELLAEYYAGFGPAAAPVKAYFDYWEQYIMQRTGQFEEVNWSRYAKFAHEVFPPDALAAGEKLLDAATRAAAPDATAAARVAFLRLGLEHAKLCCNAAATVQGAASPVAARRGLAELHRFRLDHEAAGFGNLDFCAFIEERSWRLSEGYAGEPLRPLTEAVEPRADLDAIPLRGTHVVVALLKKGENLAVDLACEQIGQYSDATAWAVFGPDDQALANGTLPPGETTRVEQTAASDGVYAMTLASGANAVRVALRSDHAAFTGPRLGLIGTGSTLYFYVPDGTVRFRLILQTDAPGETAAVVVRDPDAQTAASGETGATKEVAMDIAVPHGKAGRAWSVLVTQGGPGVFEDYKLLLDPALPPYWSHAPDRLVLPGSP